MDSIDTVYSVTELKTRQTSQEGGGVVCAIIYAFLTVLNLDAEVNLAVAERWQVFIYRNIRQALG